MLGYIRTIISWASQFLPENVVRPRLEIEHLQGERRFPTTDKHHALLGQVVEHESEAGGHLRH